jgi:hypothetical protein
LKTIGFARQAMLFGAGGASGAGAAEDAQGADEDAETVGAAGFAALITGGLSGARVGGAPDEQAASSRSESHRARSTPNPTMTAKVGANVVERRHRLESLAAASYQVLPEDHRIGCRSVSRIV